MTKSGLPFRFKHKGVTVNGQIVITETYSL